jgi:inner membrane protein
MASFGHVAVGLLAGRLHGGGSGSDGGGEAPRKLCSWSTFVGFAALALLPDADMLFVACGTSDLGAFGHRGASHSFAAALAIGLAVALASRRLGWPLARTAIAATLAVASHGVLDAFAQGGRGLPLLWPLTTARFHAPWRIIPDAPRGLQMFSQVGLAEVAIEFVLFLPITVCALWPRLAHTLRRPQPSLTMIRGGVAPTPRATAALAPVPLATDGDPPVRSSG